MVAKHLKAGSGLTNKIMTSIRVLLPLSIYQGNSFYAERGSYEKTDMN